MLLHWLNLANFDLTSLDRLPLLLYRKCCANVVDGPDESRPDLCSDFATSDEHRGSRNDVYLGFQLIRIAKLD